MMGIYNSQSVCQTGQALGHYLLTWLDVGLFFCFFFFCVSLAAINGTTINNLQVVFFSIFQCELFLHSLFVRFFT